jgi:hypothetical protein
VTFLADFGLVAFRGEMAMAEETRGTTRREVLRKGLFVAPTILTLAAVPSFASAGSDKYKEEKEEKEKEEKEKKDK